MKKQQGLQKVNTTKLSSIEGNLLEDLRAMIELAKYSVATTINKYLTVLYWKIGYRIHSEILGEREQDMEKKLWRHCRNN